MSEHEARVLAASILNASEVTGIEMAIEQNPHCLIEDMWTLDTVKPLERLGMIRSATKLLEQGIVVPGPNFGAEVL